MKQWHQENLTTKWQELSSSQCIGLSLYCSVTSKFITTQEAFWIIYFESFVTLITFGHYISFLMPSLFSHTDSELASLLLLLFPHRLFWFLRARYMPKDSQSIRCNTVHGAEAICNRAAVCRSLSLKMAYYWVIIKNRTPSASQPSQFSLYNSLLLVKNPSMCGWA